MLKLALLNEFVSEQQKACSLPFLEYLALYLKFMRFVLVHYFHKRLDLPWKSSKLPFPEYYLLQHSFIIHNLSSGPWLFQLIWSAHFFPQSQRAPRKARSSVCFCSSELFPICFLEAVSNSNKPASFVEHLAFHSYTNKVDRWIEDWYSLFDHRLFI